MRGQLANEAINWVLKHWFKHPRPQGTAPCTTAHDADLCSTRLCLLLVWLLCDRGDMWRV